MRSSFEVTVRYGVSLLNYDTKQCFRPFLPQFCLGTEEVTWCPDAQQWVQVWDQERPVVIIPPHTFNVQMGRTQGQFPVPSAQAVLISAPISFLHRADEKDFYSCDHVILPP